MEEAMKLTQDVLTASDGLQVGEHHTDCHRDALDRIGTFLLQLGKKKFMVSRTPVIGTLVTRLTRIV
jgi:hypothetical protein